MAIIAQDVFTGTDGADLAAHTMNVGTGWTEYRGQWQILSNAAALQTVVGDDIAAFDAGVRDGAFLVHLVTASSVDPYFGLVVNFFDTAFHWLIDANSGAGTWNIYEVSSATYTVRATYTAAITRATAYTVLVEVLDDTIRVSINGTVRMTYTVASRPLKFFTKFGIRVYGPLDGVAGTRFLDVELTDAASSGTAYTVFPTGGLSPTSRLTNATSRTHRGTLTPAALLTRLGVIARTFSGSITPTGLVRKGAGKTLAGSVTPAAARLTAAPAVALRGTLTPLGRLGRLIAPLFTLRGLVSLSGALRMSTGPLTPPSVLALDGEALETIRVEGEYVDTIRIDGEYQ